MGHKKWNLRDILNEKSESKKTTYDDTNLGYVPKLRKQEIYSYTYISGKTTIRKKENMAKKNTEFMKMGEAGDRKAGEHIKFLVTCYFLVVWQAD